MEYFEPRSVSEALSVLAKHGAEAKIIAGGTDVMVDIKFKEEPGGLVNIKKIPGLSGISENGAGVRIGPLTTIRDIETNALIREKLPVLWEAAHQFASLQIRNTATIGGDISPTARASCRGRVEIRRVLFRSDSETNALMREKLPVLWEAAHQFASLQIRNTATIGGNIC